MISKKKQIKKLKMKIERHKFRIAVMETLIKQLLNSERVKKEK